jgi:ABC-type dipeptide/oligopeptide/nickel transport system ATPase component
VPGPDEVIEGCRFAARCAHVEPQCTEVAPPFVDVGGTSTHLARCRRAHELAEEVAGA